MALQVVVLTLCYGATRMVLPGVERKLPCDCPPGMCYRYPATQRPVLTHCRPYAPGTKGFSTETVVRGYAAATPCP
eukprot:2543902-Rhodomonas_salina.1